MVFIQSHTKSVLILEWNIKGSMAQWVARLTRNTWMPVVSSSPIKGPCCFLEQETLPSFRSIGCFQEPF